MKQSLEKNEKMKRKEKKSLSYLEGESSKNSVLRVFADAEIVFDDCNGSSNAVGNASGGRLKFDCGLTTWRMAGPIPQENVSSISSSSALL